MRLSRLVWRNLTFYWRTNLAVVLGVGTAVAVLSGALLVGDSVRTSLGTLVADRLGNTDYVISSDHFFPESLADAVSSDSGFRVAFVGASPIILLQGIVTREESGLRARGVNVYGIDDRFWSFNERPTVRAPAGREALIGETLARELNASPGDTLLLRVEREAGIPKESLFGRREETGRTIRLTCREILDSRSLGEFSLQPRQGGILSIFVPLERLQRDLQQVGNVNALLIGGEGGVDPEGRLLRILKEKSSLGDLGLKLRILEERNSLALESGQVLLGDSLSRSAMEAAREAGLDPAGVYTYLANSMRTSERSIPYSVVTATDLLHRPGGRVRLLSGSLDDDAGAAGSIWINDWAQRDLGVSVGAPISIDYYFWLEEGRLEERSATFRLAGVLALEGDAADPDLAPDYPGITDAGSLSDWDPPFPMDLGRIRPKDEDYWDRHRSTPKAFISLQRGQELWRTRFGQLTSVRVIAAPGVDLESRAQACERLLLQKLDPGQSGFALRSVRSRGADASRGSTDFGEYFLYFSFFIIGAAILLAALFFRLGLEQRIREIGLLESTGYPSPVIRRIFVLEALALSAAGSAAGIVGSMLYAWLLLLGLRTWWVDAVGTKLLELHLSAMPLLAGALGGSAVAVLSVVLTLRGIARQTARSMLSGALEPPESRKRRSRTARLIGVSAFLLGLTLILLSTFGLVDGAAGYFGAGVLLLVALLSFTSIAFRRERVTPLHGRGWPAYIRLGSRNAGHRPGRSVLSVSMIASATFILVSLETFRHDPSKLSLDKKAGTGGFALLAESVIPLVHTLESRPGKEALNLTPAEVASLEDVRFTAFRLRPGDDASCLNLYAPQEPRILGAPQEFIRSERFSFRDSLAQLPEEKENPWVLLESEPGDGTIPAVGDANTIQYILHRSLGEELVVTNARGEPVRLRLVAALRDSIFQGELLISESHFLRAFPEQEGFRFFLLDLSGEAADRVTQVLEEGLADFGMDVTSTRDRLAAYHRVENTYLSTFQSLGGLGLVLGTVGLAAVLLRNVLERRGELALLRAVGFRRTALTIIILAENATVLLFGLATGTICALMAIAPAWIARGSAFPVGMLGVTLGAVVLVGLTSSILAVVAALRSPLLPALRAE